MPSLEPDTIINCFVDQKLGRTLENDLIVWHKWTKPRQIIFITFLQQCGWSVIKCIYAFRHIFFASVWHLYLYCRSPVITYTTCKHLKYHLVSKQKTLHSTHIHLWLIDSFLFQKQTLSSQFLIIQFFLFKVSQNTGWHHWGN